MKEVQKPGCWLIIKTVETYKVFGVWRGGYLDGDHWRLNSGIVKIEDDGDYLRFIGHSGSIYECNKRNYGTSPYGMDVLNSIKEKGDLEILSEEDAMNYLVTTGLSNNNVHLGSSFDKFLREEGIHEEAESTARKRVSGWLKDQEKDD